MAPALRYFLKLLALKNRLAPDVEFEFNSLYQLSEVEKVGVEKTEAEAMYYRAQAEEKYVAMGIRDPEGVSKEYGWEDEYTELEPTEPTTPPPAPMST
jgi:hypothetical protein